MDGSPYRLYRLEPVSESRDLPPGRYLIRNERRVRPVTEIDLHRSLPVVTVASILEELPGG